MMTESHMDYNVKSVWNMPWPPKVNKERWRRQRQFPAQADMCPWPTFVEHYRCCHDHHNYFQFITIGFSLANETPAPNEQDHRLGSPAFGWDEMGSPFSSVKAFFQSGASLVGKFPSVSACVRLVVQHQLHQSSVMPGWSALSDWWGYPSRPFADDIPLFFPVLQGRSTVQLCGRFLCQCRVLSMLRGLKPKRTAADVWTTQHTWNG